MPLLRLTAATAAHLPTATAAPRGPSHASVPVGDERGVALLARSQSREPPPPRANFAPPHSPPDWWGPAARLIGRGGRAGPLLWRAGGRLVASSLPPAPRGSGPSPPTWAPRGPLSHNIPTPNAPLLAAAASHWLAQLGLTGRRTNSRRSPRLPLAPPLAALAVTIWQRRLLVAARSERRTPGGGGGQRLPGRAAAPSPGR